MKVCEHHRMLRRDEQVVEARAQNQNAVNIEQ